MYKSKKSQFELQGTAAHVNMEKLQIELNDARKQVETVRDDLNSLQVEMRSATAGYEHFCREMIQLWYLSRLAGDMFASYPGLKSQSDYISIACQLIELGLPLDVMDGIHSFMPRAFVCDLLREVSNRTKEKTPIIVVSVMGTQSSYKSTLLNTMYGSCFGTGSGRCTRGIQLSLHRVQAGKLIG
jgi:hypothetical protein